ncbi:hypothetical protein [Taibaiella koreensis]|uniref:hypothetical protein n=1 Tax=Taibaiella koreensis TaxID=1268548 RepID=UPI000E59EBC7|nr:hypothetical protein [Taibaiella koreensis]
MIEYELTITLNRLGDIADVEAILKSQKIQSPIFVIRFEEDILIKFTAGYEHYELNREIEGRFKGYSFTADTGNGKKEVRIKIHRYQSPFSTNGWGRPIENPLDETVYLIKNYAPKERRLNPEVKVLFEDTEKYYYINIIRGIYKETEEKGFLLRESFDDLSESQSKDLPFLPKLYGEVSEAYWKGYSRIEQHAKQQFEEYLKEKKKQSRKRKK